MHGTATVKVPDGKLVELRATYDDQYEDVTITGDFFIEPPAALADLEAAIEGQPVDADTDRLTEAIAGVDAELIGFDETDLATAAREAVR
jgi:hypothetical protein